MARQSSSMVGSFRGTPTAHNASSLQVSGQVAAEAVQRGFDPAVGPLEASTPPDARHLQAPTIRTAAQVGDLIFDFAANRMDLGGRATDNHLIYFAGRSAAR